MDDYAFYCYVRDIPKAQSECAAIQARLTLAGDALGAAAVARALEEYRVALMAMAVTVSREGTKILREYEYHTRVGRPDSGRSNRAQTGGSKLEDWLYCEPLPISLSEDIGWGSIGICNETVMDKKVGWWWTQETGYDGHIGRVLYGVFQPGEAPPDSSEFRQHPLFEARGSGEVRGSGRIKRGIPARRFVENSIPEIEGLWKAELDFLTRTFESQVVAAQIP